MNSYVIECKSQKGITLIVGLIMVLLISIIGLAAIRGSGLQEQMAGNMRDLHLAFEAAEAALTTGEDEIYFSSNPTTLIGQAGFYNSFDRPGSDYWLGLGDAPFDWSADALAYEGNLDYVNEQPKYVVEQVVFLDPGSDGGAAGWQDVQNQEPRVMYRITARGTGGNENTQVVLQSTLRTSIAQ